jgi:uncharacterized YigZ family protein
MSDDDRYFVPAVDAEAEIKERGSRFLAELWPAGSHEAAAQALEIVKRRFHDATHHCYAYRIGWDEGLEERFNDDGEPHRTAGPPILAALEESGVSDALLVVVRYFGGTKLGTGGLARAYRDAARAVLAQADLAPRILSYHASCVMPYAAQGPFRRLIQDMGARILKEDFGQNWQVDIALPRSRELEFSGAVASLNEAWKGTVQWKLK